MSRRIPDFYLHLGGNHIHHLNYGIFLLAGVGAYMLFEPNASAHRKRVGIIYGIGLALTFDEFGMWLHLGGGYWQRASFDAIVVLASGLALAAFAPPLRQWRPRQTASAAILVGMIVLFGLMRTESFAFAAREQPMLDRLELNAPR